MMGITVPPPRLVNYERVKEIMDILLTRKDIDPLDAPDLAIAVHIKLQKQFNKAIEAEWL